MGRHLSLEGKGARWKLLWCSGSSVGVLGVRRGKTSEGVFGDGDKSTWLYSNFGRLSVRRSSMDMLGLDVLGLDVFGHEGNAELLLVGITWCCTLILGVYQGAFEHGYVRVWAS